MDITAPRSRYDCVTDICRKMQPESVIEIGVHNGARARKFCEAILPNGEYTGYDAWDLLTEHDPVFNGKGPGSMQKTRDNLRRILHCKVKLVKGFTQDTLWNNPKGADFVFIDGDHRTDAIRKDTQAVAEHSRLICFDDVVADGPNRAGAAPVLLELGQQGYLTVTVPFRVAFKPYGYTGIGFAWHCGDIPVSVENAIYGWRDRVLALV